jgi:hypothetical protein
VTSWRRHGWRVIGIDPHTGSHTAVARDTAEARLGPVRVNASGIRGVAAHTVRLTRSQSRRRGLPYRRSHPGVAVPRYRDGRVAFHVPRASRTDARRRSAGRPPRDLWSEGEHRSLPTLCALNRLHTSWEAKLGHSVHRHRSLPPPT